MPGATAGRWESSENAEPANSEATGGLRLEVALCSDPTTPSLILRGTEAGKFYDLFSRETFDLGSSWRVEQTITGQAGSTPVLISDTRATMFYAAGESAADSDGDGLPDAYERYVTLTEPDNPDTGNTGVSDGYKDPDGDGYTNIEEHQNGTIPGSFERPRAPQGFSANFATNGISLFWQAALGAVTGYVIERQLWAYDLFFEEWQPTGWPLQWLPLATVPSSQLTYTDNAVPETNRANYRIHSNTNAACQGVMPDTSPIRVVRGPGGGLQFVVSSMPEDIDFYRITWMDSQSYPLEWFFYEPQGIFGDWETHSFLIHSSDFTNGIAHISTNAIPAFSGNDLLWVEAHSKDCKIRTGRVYASSMISGYAIPFLDGTTQLKQNLAFLLRIATGPGYPLSFEVLDQRGDGYMVTYSPDFVYSGFWMQNYWCPEMNEFHPFEANYLYRNLVFDPAFVTNRPWGFNYYDCSWQIRTNLPYRFWTTTWVTNQFTIVPMLSQTDVRYLPGIPQDEDLPYQYAGLLRDNATGGFTMTEGARNLYGLPFLSVKCITNYPPSRFIDLLPGQSVSDSSYFAHFPEVAQPVLQTIDFYFANSARDSLPLSDSFSVTNTTPLLITSSGEQIIVAGYAKQAILNGYSNKFAYLGQYFDKAFEADAEGNVTTNETGILSEYGEFLPLEPGLTYLATKPDPDQTTNAVGYCPVHVIRLSLDVNHDGTMDQSFTGPDNTCAERPFVFWVNNDHDKPGTGGNPDTDQDEPKLPDHQYGNIRCQRNLEDFARLWVSGLPALPASQGYSVTLSMSPSSGSPSVNLYAAYDQTGGTDYLTDTNAAAAQFTQISLNGQLMRDYAQTLGEISPSQTLALPMNVDGRPTFTKFLFEGSGLGSGELKLTISQNGTNIASTSLFLALHNVKELYERAHAENVTSGLPPSTLVSEFKLDNIPAVEDSDKQFIVFVHGINNTQFDYENTSATMFKRLYWSGYRGRLAAFRWPCDYLPFENTLNPFNYNKSEFYGWKSATAFAAYLQSVVGTRLPGYKVNMYAHSQGNVVASGAVMQGAPFDNYILTQGAIPAHCYDTNVPALQKFIDAEAINATPLNLSNGGYDGYCGGLTGNLINFYNTNDFALAKGTYWFPLVGDVQANWEENQRIQKPEKFGLGPQYRYNSSTGQCEAGYYSLDGSLIGHEVVTDSYEAKAMVARSRSHAVGAQDGMAGSIRASVDLGSSFDFGRTRDEHSAQFTRPIQTVGAYYRQVLLNFNIQTTP